MQNKIRFLGGLLLLQILLVVMVLWDNEKYQAFEANDPLLSFVVSDIDKIEIFQQDAVNKENHTALLLVKTDGQWGLPELDDFAANQLSVSNLLGKLADMKRGWPVAETRSAAIRFEVGEDQFQRKIVLYKGEQESVELYLGTSPSLRKVHGRVGEEQSIYAVNFNNYEANTKAGDWVDSTVLQVTAEEIQRIQLPDVTLLREGDSFVIVDLQAGESPVQDKIDQLVKNVANINIQTALGKQPNPGYNLDSPLFQFSLEFTSTDTRDYSISKLDDSADYVLKSSDHEHYFKLAPWVINPIKSADRASLISKDET